MDPLDYRYYMHCVIDKVSELEDATSVLWALNTVMIKTKEFLVEGRASGNVCQQLLENELHCCFQSAAFGRLVELYRRISDREGAELYFGDCGEWSEAKGHSKYTFVRDGPGEHEKAIPVFQVDDLWERGPMPEFEPQRYQRYHSDED